MTETTVRTIVPLRWPPNRPRNLKRQRSSFKQRTFAQARAELVNELRRVKATNIVITSNEGVGRFSGIIESLLLSALAAADRGVAVYFRIEGRPYCFACDTFDRISDNLYAIAKHAEAARAIMRWGVAADVAQVMAGFQELQPPTEPAAPPWWRVLGFDAPPSSKEQVRDRFRVLAQRNHPDRGGDAEMMKAYSAAYETGLDETPN